MMKISIARFFDQIIVRATAFFLDFTACSSKCAKNIPLLSIEQESKADLPAIVSYRQQLVAAGHEREPFRHGKEINRTSSMQ